MKLVLTLVVAMSTWMMLMLASTSSEITIAKRPPPPPPSPPPFPKPEILPVFVLDGKSDGAYYSKFIGDLRGELEDTERLYFKVPMIRLSDRLQYMIVELKPDQGYSIKLAIRKGDLYLDGYSYTYQGKQGQQEVRARFFKLESTTIQTQVEKNLFTDAKNTGKEKNIGYEGSYDNLEGKAKLDRMDLGLGKETLKLYMNEITYKDYSKGAEFMKTEARLLLIAIQMFSEAVRFKYIGDKIKDHFSAGYTPDFRAIDLEPNWEKLTKAITAANSQTGAIPKNMLDNLRLRDAQGNLRTITNVYDIIGDMALLKYLPPASKWLTMQPVENVTVWAQ